MPPRTDEPVLPPNSAGVVDGTAADEILRVGDVDSDGDEFTNDGSQVHAGDGADTVYGGWGGDTIQGGAGDDWVFGGDSDDVLMGGGDNDTLWGDAGDDALWGDTGDDKLIGGAGDDLVTGGAGNDLLIGDSNPGDNGGRQPGDPVDPGYGNDTLVTDTGNDTAWGGSGDDVFRVFDEFGNHVIVGGETGETELGDRLDLTSVTEGLSMVYSGDEEGNIARDGATLDFSEIEKTYLGTGDDNVEVLTSTTGYVHGNDSFDTLVLPDGPDAPTVVITGEVPYDPVPGATSKTGVRGLQRTARGWISKASRRSSASRRAP